MHGDAVTSSHLPTRRAVAKGAAWSIPTITLAASAPALAASPVTGSACGTIAYPSSGTTNGRVVPISLSNGKTVYAKFSPTTSGSTQSSNTSTNNARFGTQAYGSVRGTYTISSSTNFVFNQMSTRPSNESVTVSFYSDAAATQPTAVTRVSVPINDLSTGVSWSCGPFNTNCSAIPEKSYQDVVTLTATNTTGSTIVASSTGTSNVQTQNATAPAVAGDLSSGMYFPVANAINRPNSGGTTYGGTLNTTFGTASITSFTFGYRSNIDSAASAFTGAQGVSMAPFTVCQ